MDVTVFDAFPPAARAREIQKAANTFASSGKSVFVHYVGPLLAQRRAILLQDNTVKKKFPKTAPQLWVTQDHDENFFWNLTARELRLCLKQGILRPEDCLKNAGRLDDVRVYLWHAELAVSRYLGTSPPPYYPPVETEPHTAAQDTAATTVATELDGAEDLKNLVCLDASDKSQADSMKTSVPAAILTENVVEEDITRRYHSPRNSELLATLPERYQFERKMLYSHFAHYDLNEIRTAEGKHQTAMLRQLADIFKQTGRELFYFYMVPRLCKQNKPPSDGRTVTSVAADIWSFLPQQRKDLWAGASNQLKKQLGDGVLSGLEVLQLDSLDPEVLRLHGLAVDDLGNHVARII